MWRNPWNHPLLTCRPCLQVNLPSFSLNRVFPAHALRSIPLNSYFRDKSPYTFPGGVAKIVNKNAARVAEVREGNNLILELYCTATTRSGWTSGETFTTAWTLELEMLTLETFHPGKLWGKISNANPLGRAFDFWICESWSDWFYQ